jgi:hypothetical protein
MEEEPRNPWHYWSRCKVGKDRFYWVVGELSKDDHLAEGYCTMAEEAEQAALRACPEARTTTTSPARYRHRLKVHQRRKAQAKGPGGAEVRRFVYAHAWSEYDGHEYWLAYPILKITAKRIFVGRDSHEVGDEDGLASPHDPIAESASLDRSVFEREGRIYCHKWMEVFYRELPGPSLSAPNDMIVQSLSVLGLTWPATPGEIRAAYRRRSLVAHPDTGGSDEEFRRLHEAYELCAAI